MKTARAKISRTALTVLIVLHQLISPAFSVEMIPGDQNGASTPVKHYNPLANSEPQTVPPQPFLSDTHPLDTAPPTQDTVEVYSHTVAESRNTVEDFMTLLNERGITRFTQEEVENLAKGPATTGEGIYLLSRSGDRIAIAFSGRTSTTSCSRICVHGGCVDQCYVIAVSPRTAILLTENDSDEGTLIVPPDIHIATFPNAESELEGVQMALTKEGHVVIDPKKEGFKPRLYDTEGNLIAYAERITVIPAEVDYLDANGDQKLTAREIIEGAREILTALKQYGSQRITPGSPLARFDLNGDGYFSSLDTFLVIHYASRLNAPTPYVSRTEMENLRAFRAMDQNRDFILTAAEANAGIRKVLEASLYYLFNPAVYSQYKKYDVNKDGRLTLSDHTIFLRTRRSFGV
jgi:hypothetical protein